MYIYIYIITYVVDTAGPPCSKAPVNVPSLRSTCSKRSAPEVVAATQHAVGVAA